MNKLIGSKTGIFKGLVIAVSLIWLVSGAFFMIRGFKNKYRFYQMLISLPLDGKKAAFTGQDFHQFLMFCGKKIPEGKDVKWVFTGGGFLGNSEFHFYKAYYYLYPRNYRENADYIIVYEKQGYNAPFGYVVFAEFGKNKYILIKS